MSRPDPTDLAQPPTQLVDPSGRPMFTLRAVTLGLLGALLVAVITPYNNYVAGNTGFVGSVFPVGATFLLLIVVAAINPLLRWLQRAWAFRSGELAVAWGMTLAACAIPGVGLMRYLPGHLVASHALPAQQQTYARVAAEAGLPQALTPTVSGQTALERSRDPVVQDFITRTPLVEASLWSRITSVPWRAWARPAIHWGLFFAALYGFLICISLVMQRQWIDNERLPFPLAGIYLALIEDPEPGRLTNRLLRSRSMWIAFASVFVLHAFNALSLYDPEHVPELPLRFDLNGLFTEEPWRFTDWGFRAQSIYFTVIGIAFFVQTRVVFSLWGTFVLLQMVRMVLGARGGELSGGMQADQLIGATSVFAIGVLWLARRHLAMVARAMVTAATGDGLDARESRLYWTAGWGCVACGAAMWVWLVQVAGMSVVAAVLLLGMLLALYLVIARVVAETGLLYVLVELRMNRPWVYMAQDLPAGASVRTTPRSFSMINLLFDLLVHDTRESPAVLIPHAVRVMEGASGTPAGVRRWSRPMWGIGLAVAVALGVSFAASGGSLLVSEYAYAATTDRAATAPINDWGASTMPRILWFDWTAEYLTPRTGPQEAHNRGLHLGIGSTFTGLLGLARIRLAGWPMHPVGYLLVYSWGMQMTWFSLFLGWLAKSLVVRLGGSTLYTRLRPMFMGLILGESAAAAFWLVVSLVRMLSGLEYHAIRLLPD